MSRLMILNDSASIEFSVTFGRKVLRLAAGPLAGSWRKTTRHGSRRTIHGCKCQLIDPVKFGSALAN